MYRKWNTQVMIKTIMASPILEEKFGLEDQEYSWVTTKTKKKLQKLSHKMAGSEVEILELFFLILMLSKLLTERRTSSNFNKESM